MSEAISINQQAVDGIVAEASSAIASAADLAELKSLRARVVGDQSAISALNAQLRDQRSANKRSLASAQVHLHLPPAFQTQVCMPATTLSMFLPFFQMEAQLLTRSLQRSRRVEICWIQLNSNSAKLITL